MAKVVQNFLFRGGIDIDFSQWADGQIWLLTKGEDFDCEPKQAVSKARNWAKANDKTVQTSIGADKSTVYVQFKPLASLLSNAVPATNGKVDYSIPPGGFATQADKDRASTAALQAGDVNAHKAIGAAPVNDGSEPTAPEAAAAKAKGRSRGKGKEKVAS